MMVPPARICDRPRKCMPPIWLIGAKLMTTGWLCVAKVRACTVER
ncbi:Uncharacterised protein [Bordetella pertussis]|nr:Uncharacterised protein [Bordetella pertussis]CFU84833.1 Uncharacterised protein [Bordetella pertussis]CPL34178.1 Uncharacterised protein [Bordetella pertussis]CPN74910.1 Uncharacterised protein [Bordetella pertussis]